MTIRAIAYPQPGGKRDKCPTLAFFQDQAAQHPDEFAELLAVLTRTACDGPLHNETKFKHLAGTDGLFEFKTRGGLRLFCFFDDGRLIICTHGTVKKRQKADPAEIARADRMKKEYEQAKQTGNLVHQP
jgi:hypothetical protein